MDLRLRALSMPRKPTSRPAPTNLRTPATTFIGRGHDLLALRQLFSEKERFVTVLGAAGLGKTRLAIRFGESALRSYEGGVWFCDLTEVREVDGICTAVAPVLNLPLSARGTVEDAVTRLGKRLASFNRALLILDNFEHLAEHANAT